MKLLLASKSEARRRMLKAAGVPFEPCDSAADETAAKAEFRAQGRSAIELAAELAALKASAFAAGGGALVLGSDQVLERDDGSTVDKPASRGEAEDQLRSLAGRTHRLHSAAALVEEGELVWSGSETVALTMRSFSDDFLCRYLDDEYDVIRHSVGGYRIEGPGIQLFERIEGSHFAILGLPLLPLLHYLRERGVMGS